MMHHQIFRSHHDWTVMASFPESARTSEGYIARNHLEGDHRARRALCKLQERERRIAQLEHRVIELENTASALHLLTLRASSGLNITKKYTAISGKSTSLYGTSPCRTSTHTSIDPSDREVACVMLGDNDRETSQTGKTDDSLQDANHCILNGKIPKNTRNYSEIYRNDVTKFSEGEQVIFQNHDSQKFDEYKNHVKSREPAEATRSGSTYAPKQTVAEQVKPLSAESPSRLTNRTSSLRKLFDENGSQMPGTRVISRGAVRGKRRRSSFTLKVSCSVPWMRSYRSYHRASSRNETTVVRESGRDVPSSNASTGANEEDYTDRDQVEVSLDVKEAEVPEPVEDSGSPRKAQEARPIAEMRSASTQTLVLVPELLTNYSCQVGAQNPMETSRTETLSEDKKSLSFWSISDEPPSAEEERASNIGIHYESVICELEARLGRAKAELETALKEKEFVEEDSKKALEKIREEARKENESLQDKIVRICSSILERFGPYAHQLKRKPARPKATKLLKYYERSSKRLRRRLRIMKVTLENVRKDSKAAQEAIKEKSDDYESLKKYFNRLKQQTEATSANLNNIIAENGTLREKIENMKEWLELQVPKDKAHKYVKVQCRLAQKRSEIGSLRKKSEEDFVTIAELRNKLLRMESSDANKEFLLNSYKGQLADLYKERQNFQTKIYILEKEIDLIRNIHYEADEW